jgi:hypothetical protein
MSNVYTQKAKVWLYPSDTAAWHFISLDKKLSKKLRTHYKSVSRGFGSLPVEVTVGETIWKTSIFWESKSEMYLLPLKALVRRKEDIREGSTITVKLNILA